MEKIKDALGREITYNYPPKRIVTFDPAITETLYYLGLDKEIVGRTRFCKHPEEKVNQAINVGGTKDMKIDRIHDLKPDLIIMEKEENTKEMVETLAEHYPVYVFEIQTVDDGIRMTEELGNITNRKQQAMDLKTKVETKLNKLPKANGERIAYIIWKKPYMAVGRDTYINDMLEQLGFINPFAKSPKRYPVVTEQNLQDAKLDYIFLSSEPYPFRDKHHEEFLSFLPDVQPVNIDGEMFWYGARMLKAVEYFRSFIARTIHN
ncbi:MAG TPA: helical backbone metal receptor [Candidatus Avamphibacillus sp.]|nr:helical backbone metal receptor [Candidatus Avamphibacillus sp.]